MQTIAFRPSWFYLNAGCEHHCSGMCGMERTFFVWPNFFGPIFFALTTNDYCHNWINLADPTHAARLSRTTTKFFLRSRSHIYRIKFSAEWKKNVRQIVLRQKEDKKCEEEFFLMLTKSVIIVGIYGAKCQCTTSTIMLSAISFGRHTCVPHSSWKFNFSHNVWFIFGNNFNWIHFATSWNQLRWLRSLGWSRSYSMGTDWEPFEFCHQSIELLLQTFIFWACDKRTEAF